MAPQMLLLDCLLLRNTRRSISPPPREERYNLKRQIERLQEEVEEQYRQYRDEADARRMLVSGWNMIFVYLE